MPQDATAYKGRRIRIDWARSAAGRWPAQEFFHQELTDAEKAKFLSLFELLGDRGQLFNKLQFRHLKGEDLYEFKTSTGARLLGDFRTGRFVIAHGFRKQSQKTPQREIRTAQRILGEHDAQEENKQS